jgi:hypothetical protein
LLPHGCLHRSNPEKATLVPVEKSRENTWGVELGKAAPVNGTIPPNQSHGMEISNHSVILNWLIAIGSGVTFGSFRFLHTFASAALGNAADLAVPPEHSTTSNQQITRLQTENGSKADFGITFGLYSNQGIKSSEP